MNNVKRKKGTPTPLSRNHATVEPSTQSSSGAGGLGRRNSLKELAEGGSLTAHFQENWNVNKQKRGSLSFNNSVQQLFEGVGNVWSVHGDGAAGMKNNVEVEDALDAPDNITSFAEFYRDPDYEQILHDQNVLDRAMLFQFWKYLPAVLHIGANGGIKNAVAPALGMFPIWLFLQMLVLGGFCIGAAVVWSSTVSIVFSCGYAVYTVKHSISLGYRSKSWVCWLFRGKSLFDLKVQFGYNFGETLGVMILCSIARVWVFITSFVSFFWPVVLFYEMEAYGYRIGIDFVEAWITFGVFVFYSMAVTAAKVVTEENRKPVKKDALGNTEEAVDTVEQLVESENKDNRIVMKPVVVRVVDSKVDEVATGFERMETARKGLKAAFRRVFTKSPLLSQATPMDAVEKENFFDNITMLLPKGGGGASADDAAAAAAEVDPDDYIDENDWFASSSRFFVFVAFVSAALPCGFREQYEKLETGGCLAATITPASSYYWVAVVGMGILILANFAGLTFLLSVINEQVNKSFAVIRFFNRAADILLIATEEMVDEDDLLNVSTLLSSSHDVVGHFSNLVLTSTLPIIGLVSFLFTAAIALTYLIPALSASFAKHISGIVSLGVVVFVVDAALLVWLFSAASVQARLAEVIDAVEAKVLPGDNVEMELMAIATDAQREHGGNAGGQGGDASSDDERMQPASSLSLARAALLLATWRKRPLGITILNGWIHVNQELINGIVLALVSQVLAVIVTIILTIEDKKIAMYVCLSIPAAIMVLYFLYSLHSFIRKVCRCSKGNDHDDDAKKKECNGDEGPKDVDIEKSPLSNVPSSSDDVNKGIKNSVELVSSSSSSSSSSVPASASKHSAATATAAVPPVIELDLAHMRESVSVIGRKDSTTFQFDLHVETEDEDVKADTKKYPKKESEKADKHPTDRKSRKRE